MFGKNDHDLLINDIPDKSSSFDKDAVEEESKDASSKYRALAPIELLGMLPFESQPMQDKKNSAEESDKLLVLLYQQASVPKWQMQACGSFGSHPIGGDGADEQHFSSDLNQFQQGDYCLASNLK